MLYITIKGGEAYDEKSNLFINTNTTTIALEHSLVSISKWESKYHVPFISKDTKTKEQIIYYVKCMTITQNVDENIYSFLSNKNMQEINSYIENSMTATWFEDDKKKANNSKEVITSELIYYWMIAYQIPIECQKWHINRLLTLIRVCNAKNNASNNKYSEKEILSSNAKLNALRRKQLGSKG